MATSKQCQVPTKEDPRLDHATKLEASLSRNLEFHCKWQHMSAYVNIFQHASAYVSIRHRERMMLLALYVLPVQLLSIRQRMSAYVSIRQHTSAYVSIRQRPDDAAHPLRPASLCPPPH
jgi:hypothetical protein